MIVYNCALQSQHFTIIYNYVYTIIKWLLDSGASYSAHYSVISWNAIAANTENKHDHKQLATVSLRGQINSHD